FVFVCVYVCLCVCVSVCVCVNVCVCVRVCVWGGGGVWGCGGVRDDVVVCQLGGVVGGGGGVCVWVCVCVSCCSCANPYLTPVSFINLIMCSSMRSGKIQGRETHRSLPERQVSLGSLERPLVVIDLNLRRGDALVHIECCWANFGAPSSGD